MSNGMPGEGGGSPTALVVEDSPTQSLRLKILLEDSGYEVAIAPNGREALEQLAGDIPDVIISDVVMPEMDGFELCARVKQSDAWKSIPVVLLTSLTSPEDVRRGLEAGADDYLTKPYNQDSLLARVHSVWRERTSLGGKTGLSVLVVEDSPTQARKLQQLLEQAGCSVRVARDGEEGLSVARAERPDIILTDILMPRMDGYEFCRRVKNEPLMQGVPVVLLTVLADPSDIIRGLNSQADSYLTKPYDDSTLLATVKFIAEEAEKRSAVSGADGADKVEARRMSFGGRTLAVRSSHRQTLDLLMATYENAIRQNRTLIGLQARLRALNATLEERVVKRTADLKREVEIRRVAQDQLAISVGRLEEALSGVVETLTRVVEARDSFTAGHQRGVARLAAGIASAMGLDSQQVEAVRIAALVHDVGKVAVPMEILAKTHPLTDAEFLLVQNHCQAGHEILKGIQFPWPIAKMVVQHHERMDGSGYPAGLAGTDILLESRILAVADVADAMVSPRHHRPPHCLDVAIEELTRGQGTIYDSDVCEACLRLLTEEGYHDKVS